MEGAVGTGRWVTTTITFHLLRTVQRLRLCGGRGRSLGLVSRRVEDPWGRRRVGGVEAVA